MDYSQHTLIDLRKMILNLGLVPKKSLISYIRKQEAIEILENYKTSEDLPENYLEVLHGRRSLAGRKSYQRRKTKVSAPLNLEERKKKAVYKAPLLKYVTSRRIEDGFLSFLGSTNSKVALIFTDEFEKEVLLTRKEARDLEKYGLIIPKSVKSPSGQERAPAPEKIKKRLKDLL